MNSSGDCGFYVSDGTKFEGFEILQQAPGTLALTVTARIEHITNSTTDGATAWGGTNGSMFTPATQRGAYFGWCYNGTDLYAETSLDGVNWTPFYEETSPFLTPSFAAFGGVFTSSTNVNELVSLQGWQSQTVGSCP